MPVLFKAQDVKLIIGNDTYLIYAFSHLTREMYMCGSAVLRAIRIIPLLGARILPQVRTPFSVVITCVKVVRHARGSIIDSYRNHVQLYCVGAVGSSRGSSQL